MLGLVKQPELKRMNDQNTQYITLTSTVSISPAEFGISERPVDEEVDKVAARLDRQHHAGLQQNPCVCIT